MKRNKFLTLTLGFAILSGLVCSGIILVSGIQDNAGALSHNTGIRKEKYPEPHTLEKTKLEEFTEADIHLDDANLSILPSDGYYLEYRLDGTCNKPEYGVDNGKFHFQEGTAQKKFRISFSPIGNPANSGPLYLNLYVPEDHYFKLLNITMESGNIEDMQANAEKAEFAIEYGNLSLEGFTGGDFTVSSESGNIKFGEITCDNLSISAEYGDFSGDTVSASGRADISLESGNMDVSKLTADTLSVRSQYGNCEIGSVSFKDGTFSLESGNLYVSGLTANSLSVENLYGSCGIDGISIKKGIFSMESGNLTLGHATLGNTSATSEYGDVKLELSDQISDYSYDLETEYGTINVGGDAIEGDEDGRIFYRKQDGKQKKNISIFCESGNVTIQKD